MALPPPPHASGPFARWSGLPWRPGGLRSGDGDKSPFYARGTGQRAALCFHGFTGTPFEVRPLAEALAAQGYTTLAPVLAGHGGTIDDLAATTHTDWLASAESALEALRTETGGAPVLVAGFSLGGLLALRLARLHPESVAALAVMAAPLRLSPLQVVGIRAIARLPRVLRRGLLHALPKSSGFDVVDQAMAALNPSLTALPLAGVNSLLDLAALVRADLPHITTPILVAHGSHDRTVPIEDSLELIGTIGSTTIERLWLERSGHLLAIDVERRTLIDAVLRFFAKVPAWPSTRP
ncbi:MAG TPA: alpha/beta fold hydrolase [Polyangia bacterium]